MNRKYLFALAPVAMLAACGSQSEDAADPTPTASPPTPTLLGSATLSLADGKSVGTAELNGNGEEVSISVVLSGLPEGVRAVHLHTTGSCEAPDFASAGGHLNPGMHEHGKENPKGAHLGDLPNATIDANGDGTITAALTGTQADVRAAIFDTDGTAIVVHQDQDDYKTDPTGNAGGRLACGVFAAS